MEDLLSDPSDDNVSDVDPEELQKMIRAASQCELHFPIHCIEVKHVVHTVLCIYLHI